MKTYTLYKMSGMHVIIYIYERMIYMNEQQLTWIMQYEKEVYKVTRKYQKYFDQEDLYQVGMIGLMKAVNHLDPSRIDEFASYARFYIQGEINQFLRENNPIKLSKEALSEQRKYDMAKEKLTQKFGRNPTIEEIAFVLETDVKKVEEIEQSRIQIRSLDYQQEEDAPSLYHYIKQEETAYQAEFQDLYRAIASLPSPDKEIIIAQFFEDKTQTEIAEELGMSQVQVYRKKEHGLQMIKQKVA